MLAICVFANICLFVWLVMGSCRRKFLHNDSDQKRRKEREGE